MQKIKSNPSKTALTITVGLLFIFWFTKLNWILILSILIGTIGVLSESLSRYIERLWLLMSQILSSIVPNIFLGIVFFLVLWPISFLAKIFRKGDILKLNNTSSSMYTVKNITFDKQYFEKMW